MSLEKAKSLFGEPHTIFASFSRHGALCYGFQDEYLQGNVFLDVIGNEVFTVTSYLFGGKCPPEELARYLLGYCDLPLTENESVRSVLLHESRKETCDGYWDEGVFYSSPGGDYVAGLEGIENDGEGMFFLCSVGFREVVESLPKMTREEEDAVTWRLDDSPDPELPFLDSIFLHYGETLKVLRPTKIPWKAVAWFGGAETHRLRGAGLESGLRQCLELGAGLTEGMGKFSGRNLPLFHAPCHRNEPWLDYKMDNGVATLEDFEGSGTRPDLALTIDDFEKPIAPWLRRKTGFRVAAEEAMPLDTFLRKLYAEVKMDEDPGWWHCVVTCPLKGVGSFLHNGNFAGHQLFIMNPENGMIRTRELPANW